MYLGFKSLSQVSVVILFKKMKSSSVFLCNNTLFVLIFMSFIFHVVFGSGPPKVQIVVKTRPTDCPIKSQKGDILYVHYTATLDDDTEYDNSIIRGSPLVFKLGAGEVIKGWDQSMIGMCEGEQRKLVIPPELAYGDEGSPPSIPKFATLTFHVELLKIERKEEL